MRPTYSLTYDVITEKSAAIGDFAESGFQREPIELGREFGLADAIREARAEGCCIDESCPADYSRREASFYSDYEQNYRTGDERAVAAHFSNMTPSTLRRIARALKAR